MPSSPTFEQCVWACWNSGPFMREYRRLSGHALGEDRREPIERMIDAATGYTPKPLEEAEGRAFLEFVRDYVWRPLLPDGARQ